MVTLLCNNKSEYQGKSEWIIPIADNAEAKSSSTGTSNSLELMCSQHITDSVALSWRLAQAGASGRASVRGITLSQAMIDIVRMSPLNWGK